MGGFHLTTSHVTSGPHSGRGDCQQSHYRVLRISEVGTGAPGTHGNKYPPFPYKENHFEWRPALPATLAFSPQTPRGPAPARDWPNMNNNIVTKEGHHTGDSRNLGGLTHSVRTGDRMHHTSLCPTLDAEAHTAQSKCLDFTLRITHLSNDCPHSRPGPRGQAFYLRKISWCPANIRVDNSGRHSADW